MLSTISSTIRDRFIKSDEHYLVRCLCDEYGVKNVIREYNVPKERKMDLFLLGGTFSNLEIRGVEYETMIKDETLYIFEVEHVCSKSKYKQKSAW